MVRCRFAGASKQQMAIPLMQICAMNTRESIKEAARLTRRRYYWVRTGGEGAYHILYVWIPSIILGWFGCRAFPEYLFGPKVERDLLKGIFSACIAASPFVLLGLVIIDMRRARREMRAMCGPVNIAITDEGIANELENGSTACEWNRYAGFHFGRSVIVLPLKDAPGVYARIPLETLSSENKQEIRSLLSSRLPEMSREATQAATWRKTG